MNSVEVSVRGWKAEVGPNPWFYICLCCEQLVKQTIHALGSSGPGTSRIPVRLEPAAALSWLPRAMIVLPRRDAPFAPARR